MLRSNKTETTLPHDGLTASVWTIAELLAAPVRIPDYQRPYTWSSHNVGQLIDDIREFQSADSYRLGTIILHADESGKHIVDGQQRFLTCVLLARVLRDSAAIRALQTTDQARRLLEASVLEEVALSPFDLESTTRSLTANDAYIRQVLGDLPDEELVRFAEYFLESCQVVVLTVASLDAAFQMFDSQNTRGRALYPTDLLKAFHIREMSSERVDPRLKLDMVRLWESIPPAHINTLFSDCLFQIKRWSSGRSVPESGFRDVHVELFKGIRESDPANSTSGWSRPFLYAKNFTDDFRQENATLVRYRAIAPLDYPHQIDQPVINGETFFQMVAHYYSLAQRIGVFADGQRGELSGTLWADSLGRALGFDEAVDPGDSRLVRVRNLFECLALYYWDRFGEPDAGVLRLLLQYVAALRITLSSLRQLSVDNYALGIMPGGEIIRINLFRELREATRPVQVTRHSIPAPGKVPDEQRVAALRKSLRTALWPSSEGGRR